MGNSTVEPKLEILLVDARKAVDDVRVDYVPFGMKVLKIQVRKLSGPARRVWLRTLNFKRNEDPCAIYGYADDGKDLQVVWGAGDIMGFSANYREQAGTKKPVALDDDAPHVVYLHLFHRPAQPESHQLRERQLTIVAVTSDDDVEELVDKPCGERQHEDRILASKTFTLTVPEGAEDPLHAVWQPLQGERGSALKFAGRDVPDYVSRWWPSRRVTYRRMESLPEIELMYGRPADAGEGTIDVWMATDEGREHLARIAGHLTLPLHDLRWFVPELYRFYGGQQLVLRVSFLWIDERIDADDLISFVPERQRQARRAQAESEAARIMKRGILSEWLGWGKMYEIPDVERFDIIFNRERPSPTYVASDGHWREYWTQVAPGEAAHCFIAGPKDAWRVIVDHYIRHFQFFDKEPPQPVTNPLAEGGLAEVITSGRCHYERSSGEIVCSDAPHSRPRAPGLLGKNAPSITNGELMADGMSSDVLHG